MLVLSRKSNESVVVGGSEAFQRILKVTVLEINGSSRKAWFRRRPGCTGASPGNLGANSPSRTAR